MSEDVPLIEKILGNEELYKEQNGQTYIFIDRLEYTLSSEEFEEVCNGDVLKENQNLILSWEYEEDKKEEG